MGGCGKPGHVTAGSDEGTQWCATCVTEGEALAPWHFIDREEHADVFSGGMFMAKCRSALAAREIVEGMNARVKLRRQLSEAHNKNCKLQDDVAAIVSSHRLDWSWNDVLSDVRALKQPVPDVTMQQILDAGLNAFGLQLFAESVAGKKDAKTFQPLSFRYRGVKVTLQPDGEIDTSHH